MYNQTQETNNFGNYLASTPGVPEEIKKVILPITTGGTSVNPNGGHNSNHHNNITVNHVHIHTGLTPTS